MIFLILSYVYVHERLQFIGMIWSAFTHSIVIWLMFDVQKLLITENALSTEALDPGRESNSKNIFRFGTLTSFFCKFSKTVNRLFLRSDECSARSTCLNKSGEMGDNYFGKWYSLPPTPPISVFFSLSKKAGLS